jgi:hypothetical protein
MPSLFDELNEDNFILFASRHYDNPQCLSVDEFYNDVQRFKYLKRLFRRYTQNSDLQERLILNHLVVLYNVFGIRAANRMMFYKMEDEYLSAVKTFLVYLNYLPEDQYVDVPLDWHIVEVLRKL